MAVLIAIFSASLFEQLVPQLSLYSEEDPSGYFKRIPNPALRFDKYFHQVCDFCSFHIYIYIFFFFCSSCI